MNQDAVNQGQLFGATPSEQRAEVARLHELWHEAEQWGPALCHESTYPSEWTGCQPSVQERYEYPEGWYDEAERRRRELWPTILLRGWCMACGWTGPERGEGTRDGENAAVEDAHDHAWPGWRKLPIMPRASNEARNGNKKALQRWSNEVASIAGNHYPEGWLQRGGAPICTEREEYATRHVPGYSPFGGYDLAVKPRRQRVPKGGDTRGKDRAGDAHPPSAKRRARRDA